MLPTLESNRLILFPWKLEYAEDVLLNEARIIYISGGKPCKNYQRKNLINPRNS